MTVAVRVSTGDFVEPVLEIRSAGAPWETRSLGALSTDGLATVLRSLSETVDYRVVYKKHRSARFRLTPFDPPKLLHLRARVDPPDYARRKPAFFEDVLSLRVGAGSRVRWSLEMDPVDSLLRVDGENPQPLEKIGPAWV